MIALQRRLSLRTAILLGAAGLAVIAASGLVEAETFTLPTTLKYCLTIAAPLVVFATALMEKPLHLITGLTIIAAPFVGETAELAGERVSLLVPLLLAGFALAVVSEVDRRPPSALRWPDGWLSHCSRSRLPRDRTTMGSSWRLRCCWRSPGWYRKPPRTRVA